MKHTGMAVLLALGALTGRAQQRQGIHVQPQFLVGSSVTDGDLYKETFASQSVERGADKLFISGGVNAGYMFNNHFGLYTGVSYSSFTWQSRVVVFNGTYPEPYVVNTNQAFVQVPLCLRYVSSKPGKIGFLGTFGPRFSFLTSERETSYQTGISTIHNAGNYNSAIVAIGLGLGVSIPCSKKIALDLLLDSQATSAIYKNDVPHQQLQSSAVLIGLDVAL